MNNKNNAAPTFFFGEYEIRLDNRMLYMPEPFLKKLLDESPIEKSIFFFPYDVLMIFGEKGIQKLMAEARNRSDQFVARMIWHLTAKNGIVLSPDGKVEIPAAIIEKYSFSNDETLSLIGMMDRIEVWKQKNWIEERGKLDNFLAPYTKDDLESLL